jgi:hypothetical protein
MPKALGSSKLILYVGLTTVLHPINLTIGANLPNPKNPIKQELNYPVD